MGTFFLLFNPRLFKNRKKVKKYRRDEKVNKDVNKTKN